MSARDDAATSGFESQGSASLPPTFAAFSPVTLSANTPSRSTRRSTIIIHQKSPLLLATPPQVTRALAYSHPFLLPLNKLVGLLTWSTGDPWQSFLLLSAFWAVVLYGDVVVKRSGPIALGVLLITGMYARRYSPLSSSGWREPARELKDDLIVATTSSGNSVPTSPEKDLKKNKAEKGSKHHQRGPSEVTNVKHQKTLDEIVETLKEFTGRCNVLMEPLLDMTDFLSTQRTPTSATTKPALTAMFIRLLVTSPVWFALTLPPWRIITTTRVVLVGGTLLLTWHARVMRVSRTILWRSSAVRRLAAAITGLRFEGAEKVNASTPKLVTEKIAARKSGDVTTSHGRSGSGRVKSSGVRFTFIVFENQRRWVGLGWTASLFAYERAAWTDEHNNPVPQKDEFELPHVDDGSRMRWQWEEGSRWRVEGVVDEYAPVDYDGDEAKNGWVYYDNKWQNGRRGQDGWGRWTRRRKWYRDAELVEVDESEAAWRHANGSAGKTYTERYSTVEEKMVPSLQTESGPPASDDSSIAETISKTADDAASVYSTSSRSSFWPTSFRKRNAERSRPIEKEPPKKASEPTPDLQDMDDSMSGLGVEVELELEKQGKDGGQWGIGDEARMNLE